MKKLIVSFAVLGTLSGCAVVSNLRSGNVGGAVAASRDVAHDEGVAAVQATKRGSEDNDRLCEPLKTAPVGWAEERSLGGAVLINVLKAGYFIDKDDEHDPKKLADRVAKGDAITLSPSEKNDLTTYVERVGANLAAFSTRPAIPWAFGVVESPDPNAFSTPGGYVVVTTGLLKLTGNEAQLAGVLAHEIAHVTQRHSLKTYQVQRAFVCKQLVYVRAYKDLGLSQLPGEAAAWASVALDGLNVMGPNGFDLDSGKGGFLVKIFDFIGEKLASGHEKEDEFEADALAMELVSAAGYDNAEYGALLKKLPEGGGVLANHPKTSDRVAKLDEWRKENPFAAGNVKPPLEFTKALK